MLFFFFFSSRRRHTRFLPVSWARRCVQETGISMEGYYSSVLSNPLISYQSPTYSRQPRTSELYSEKIQRIQSQFRHLDEEKMQDMKDIEQEEFYLSKLREQRDKMNALKIEFDNKGMYIKQLEQELTQLNSLKEKHQFLIETNQTLNQKIEYLLNEIKKITDEKNKLQGEVDKQANYNLSLIHI
eukprot:TRINITY_DN1831_c0_g1_i3.p3 TRINITY_DN1831_c0_g1~~TRINITY_DN1831_c0_g1_i3.p3  ORF type:complete len:185 (+),score=51.33 TRINITY_DN1831_c0_g1_i3:3-557(+)